MRFAMAEDIADHIVDDAASDDHDCKFVFVVECDHIPGARSSLETATGHELCTGHSKRSPRTTLREDAGGGVAERRELFSSSHCPTDARAWAEADARGSVWKSPSQEAGESVVAGGPEPEAYWKP